MDDRRLRDLFEHARRNVPYYAGLLPPSDQPLPEDLAALLATLPLLSRREIRRQGVRLLDSGGDTSTWRRVRTSGTTGEPLEVILDDHALRAEGSALTRHLERWLPDDDWRCRDLYYLTLHPSSTSRTIAAPWRTGSWAFKWNLTRIWLLDDRAFVDRLRRIHGHVVTALPSVAELLAARLGTAGAAADIRPSTIVLSGEAVEPSIRRTVSEVLGCPVSATYNLAEAGIVAVEDPVTGHYEVDPSSAVVEIVDGEGQRVSSGVEGEIAVTPLANRAMPLLRYRCGDRGRWLEEPADGGGRRLELTGTRWPARLVTASGSTVNVVRFAKVLGDLDLEQYALSQPEETRIVFRYRGPRRLDPSSEALVRTVVRGALGPAIGVEVLRVEKLTSGERTPAPAAPARPGAEPEGPSVASVADWLREELSSEDDVQAAVLTGSGLDLSATTRFSDLDLVIFVAEGPAPRWVERSRRLRDHLPKLSVNVDVLAGFSRRSPLLACRLLCEQVAVVGRLDESRLPWPSLRDLRLQGRFRTQETLGRLWLHRIERRGSIHDPVREAWLAVKQGLDALRFRSLAAGCRETSAAAMVESLRREPSQNAPWIEDFLAAYDVAREHRPPPPATPEIVDRYLAASFYVVRSVLETLSTKPC